MQTYISQNLTVISTACAVHVEKAKDELLKMLQRIAEGMVKLIDGAFGPFNPPNVPSAGNMDFPVWFGQMRDATGVAIYCDGRVYKFVPTKRASDKQPQKDGDIKNIIGVNYLDAAISEASSVCARGIWIVLFSAVPYAVKINVSGSPIGRGIGYFDRLSDKELSDIIFGLEMHPMFDLNKK